jgi:hypothetical protein
MPGIINIEAMTTLTGEQRAMMDGIITETRPEHKAHAPGLPAVGKASREVPLIKTGQKVPATKSAMGMRHIRGTRY